MSVTLPDQSVVTFKYDPFGRRIQKVAGSSTTVFVYDGANIIEEVDSSGLAVARYTQGLGIDEPLAMLRGSATHYYQADGLGSISSMTDSNGLTAATYSYDSFGNLTASTGTLTNPFRYTARESDPETELYFYRARYYDSTMGRFLAEDPSRFRGGINWFPYVSNHPTLLVDPSGQVAMGFGLGLAGVISTPQAEGIFCFACKTICDLEGIYVKFEGFAGKGGAASGGLGVSVGKDSLVVHGSGGLGVGGGVAGGLIVGECKLAAGGSDCKECKAGPK